MAYQQDATFRIAGRITTKRITATGTQIGLSVQRREPDPTAARGWKNGRADHFAITITNPAMRAYVNTLDVQDYLVAEGELATTSFVPDGSVRPVNATKLVVHRLSGIPRSVADQIDLEVDRKPVEGGKAPF